MWNILLGYFTHWHRSPLFGFLLMHSRLITRECAKGRRQRKEHYTTHTSRDWMHRTREAWVLAILSIKPFHLSNLTDYAHGTLISCACVHASSLRLFFFSLFFSSLHLLLAVCLWLGAPLNSSTNGASAIECERERDKWREKEKKKTFKYSVEYQVWSHWFNGSCVYV